MLLKVLLAYKRRAVAAAATLATVVLAAAPVVAAQPLPDSAGGRYIFNQQADGFLRLDTQTGEVALCSRKEVGFACQAAPEDRAVLENEIARLRTENATLKKDIISRGLPLPPGAAPEPEPPLAQNGGSQGGQSELRLPDDAEIDRMTAFVGRVWHRLVDAINRAQQQILNKG